MAWAAPQWLSVTSSTVANGQSVLPQRRHDCPWLISTHETLWDMLKNILLKKSYYSPHSLISTSSTSKYIWLISVFVFMRANGFVIYWFLSNLWTVKIYKICLSVVYQNFRFSEWCCNPWMINVWHTNPTLRNLCWLYGEYVCCLRVFFSPLAYSSSFLSPPPTHYHPTLFWSSYKQRDLSHSLSHTLSLTDAYQNISNWFCLCAFCLMRPVAQALKAPLLTIEKNRGRKRAIEMRKNSISSSSTSSSPLCSSTNHTFFDSENAERLGQQM